MKKIYYIVGLLIFGLISFKPVNNYLIELERQEHEQYVNRLNSYHSFYESSRKLPKDQRPDLRGLREHLMTVDLSEKRVPKERLIEAIKETEERKSTYAFRNRMTEVDWEERGPNTIGGRTRAVMFDPNNSTKIWAAGVNGGLWYNNDITSNTQNWNLVDGTWASLAVSSMAYDPNDTDVMYVGTGERFGNWVESGSNWYSPGASAGIGMFKSTDGGNTWTHLSSTSDFAFITDIFIRDENGQNAIYITVAGNEYEGTYVGRAATGIWKSTDQGNSWTRVTETIQETTGNTEFNNIQEGVNGRLWSGSRMNSYWSGGGEIYYSDDNGSTWSSASWSSGLNNNANRVDVRVAPSDPNTVYALIGQIATPRWLAKTTDNGASWTVLDLPTNEDTSSQSYGGYLSDVNGTANWAIGFGVDATDSNTIYAGVIDAYKSTDGGVSWTHISDWRGSGGGLQYLHADHHAVRSINNNEIVFANDGGIFYTVNGGTNIYQRNEGYNVGQFYSVALHPEASNQYVLGGTQDNGSWKIGATGIASGSEVTGGDGGFAHIDQLDPNYQFTASNGNNIYRSTNGGLSWSFYSNHTEGTLINPSGIDSSTKTIYTNAGATGIMRLDNYTALASKYTMDINLGSSATFFKASPHTDDVIFVGTAGGRIFKILKASTSSFSVEEITGSNVQGYISSIDIGASDEQILITVSNYGAQSIFETYSGGGPSGWINVEGDLPDMPVRAALYNRNNFNQVIAGTDLGTWTCDDISTSSPAWVPSNDGLDNVRVDMLVNRSSDGAIAAATHGRGIFYSANGFTSTAPLNAAFSPDKTSGVFPLTINFSDRSTGNVSGWSWDFGDGNTSTEQSPSHTFATAGKYTVSLQVTDGTSNDSESKTDLVWATAVQDTLYEEGFESVPYGRVDFMGRNTYSWTIYNQNNDADAFSWWYYTAGYGAVDGSHWMAGLGMAGAGAADDWLVSPELHLRPGTDNILSFYTNMNAGSETYDVLLSPNGGLDLEDFTVTLANIVDENTATWTQQTYDLSAYAGSKVRLGIHVKTTTQQYAFWDGITVTAGQLSADGAPLAPQGIVAVRDIDGGAQVDAIELYWNRNGEPDFESYNVYGSLTEGFTADSSTLLGQGTLGDVNSTHFEPSPSTTPWPDTTFIYTQTFSIDNYVHPATSGEEWFFKVSAVDTDGNETLSDELSFLLDTVPPTAGTFTVENLVDGYLKSLTEITVDADGFSDDTGIVDYVLDIGTSNTSYGSAVIAAGDELTLTGLSLPDQTELTIYLYARDGGGNNSELVSQNVTTYVSYLGDYDSDNDVDIEDLNVFVNAWPNAGVDSSVDLGPATGTAPYLIPSPDNVNDVKDLSVFSRMWLWTKAQGRTVEDIEIMPTEFEAEILGNQIIIELPEGVTAGRFEIGNTNNIYDFNTEQKQGYLVLENENEENEYYEVEFGNLSSNDGKIVINIDGAPISSDVELNYQFFTAEGMIGNGMMQLRNPDEFNLYQNYPNPFNNQTTIMYDIPSLMVNTVDVEILIYNTVGTLVRTLDEGDKGAGQHTTLWDGRNDDGEKVSSGVYFYQLRAKVDGQSDYNKTKKMVIVR